MLEVMTQHSEERALSVRISNHFIALTFISQCWHHCALHKSIAGKKLLRILNRLCLRKSLSEAMQILTLINYVKLAYYLYSLSLGPTNFIMELTNFPSKD